jgi:hypothetical protein
LWAQNLDEVKNPQHPIHQYMNDFAVTCSKNTNTEKAAFLQHHAAIYTYNVKRLYPEGLSDEETRRLFYYNVDKVTEKYKINF